MPTDCTIAEIRTRPPWRADQVGSLLRPAALDGTRAAFKRGELDAEALREAEDRAIRDAVQRQHDIGLHAVTDGEFRRDWWHLDFLGQLDGVTLSEKDPRQLHCQRRRPGPAAAPICRSHQRRLGR